MRTLRSLLPVFISTFVVLIIPLFAAPNASAGTFYSDEIEWLNAITVTNRITEDFESFSPGSHPSLIVAWGTLQPTWIADDHSSFDGNTVSVGSTRQVALRTVNPSSPIGFGLSFKGFLRIWVKNGSEVIDTISFQNYAIDPVEFVGWIADPGEDFDRVEWDSSSGTSYLDDVSFIYGYRPATEETLYILSDDIAALTDDVSRLAESNNDALRIAIESALSKRSHVPCLYLPQAFGGKLELVRDIVTETLANCQLAGMDVGKGPVKLAEANTAFAEEKYLKAYRLYLRAFNMK